MSKMLSLNIAHRYLIRGALVNKSVQGDIDTDAAVWIAALTDALDLEGAETELSRIEREIQHAAVHVRRELNEVSVEIDALTKAKKSVPTDLYSKSDELAERLADMPQEVTYTYLLRADVAEYELDNADFQTLFDYVTKNKWNTRIQRTPQGDVSLVKKTLLPDEAKAIASLISALRKVM